MTDYLELLLEEQEQEETKETLGVALEEHSLSPAHWSAQDSVPEQAAQSEVPSKEKGADAAFSLSTAPFEGQRRNTENRQDENLPAAAPAGSATEAQDPLAAAEQQVENEAVGWIFTGSKQRINGMTAQWRGLAGDGTAGVGRARSETAAAGTPDWPIVAVSLQEERSVPQAQAGESPAAQFQAMPAGTAWLYRQLRTGEAAAGYARRETNPITVVERTSAPADGGLSALELDRTLERDARRYDGGFTLF